MNLNGIISETQAIEYCVPQGSVLGPLLFILYVNDLPSVHFSSSVSIYADDTVMYLKCKDLYTLMKDMQKDIDTFYEWCKLNKLTLNIKKTKAMIFAKGRRNNFPAIDLTIDGKTLEVVKSFNYLGLMLDGKLNFQQHYSNLAKKIGYKIHLFSQVRSFMDERTAVIVYKSHLLSIMEYGNIFLEGLTQQLKQKLQRFQNRCLHICHGCNKYTSSFELHKSSNLLPLKHRRKITMGCVMFKRICKKLSVLYVSERSGNRSSQNRTVKVPFPNSESFKNSTAYNIPNAWNNLLIYNRESKDIRSFRVQMKKYVLQVLPGWLCLMWYHH